MVALHHEITYCSPIVRPFCFNSGALPNTMCPLHDFMIAVCCKLPRYIVTLVATKHFIAYNYCLRQNTHKLSKSVWQHVRKLLCLASERKWGAFAPDSWPVDAEPWWWGSAPTPVQARALRTGDVSLSPSETLDQPVFRTDAKSWNQPNL
jgi:hypothetical protein